jgi:nitrite reductase [NAD(P)H] large subunit
MTEKLVIVGNGMAAARLVDEVTSRAPGRYEITVIGDEPGLAYNRVLLSSLLARELEEKDIELKPAAWWTERGVTLQTGKRATEIDLRCKYVRLPGGERIPYDRLVLATGSNAIRLPLAGADLPGVLTFRDRSDVDAMLKRSQQGTRAIVIGGGLLGLEAAYGLMKAGARVTVVHLMDRLMERQLDERAGAMLKAAIEATGIEVLLNAESAAIQGRKKVGGLRLKNGRSIDADMIVMAVGIRPNADLARLSGVTVNRGITVDDTLETSEQGVYALGECAEHQGICYGLVEPAYEQARVLADRLTDGKSLYSGSLLSTNLKVSGIGVFSAGDFVGGDASEDIVLSDPERATYRKIVTTGGRVSGAVLIGDTEDALWYLNLIRSQDSATHLRDGIVFGRSFCQTGDAAKSGNKRNTSDLSIAAA